MRPGADPAEAGSPEGRLGTKAGASALSGLPWPAPGPWLLLLLAPAMLLVLMQS